MILYYDVEQGLSLSEKQIDDLEAQLFKMYGTGERSEPEVMEDLRDQLDELEGNTLEGKECKLVYGRDEVIVHVVEETTDAKGTPVLVIEADPLFRSWSKRTVTVSAPGDLV